MNSKDYSGIAAAYSSIYADPYLEAKTDVKSILESLYVFETSEETEHFVEDLFTEDAEAIEFVLELYTITEESGFLLTEDVQNLQEDIENLHEIFGALKRVGAKVASKAGPALGGLKKKAGAALSKVTGAVKSGVGKVVQKGKDLVNRAAVSYANRAGVNVVNPNTGKTLKAGQNLGMLRSPEGKKAVRDAVVKDIKGKISGAVDKVKSGASKVKSVVGGALKNPAVRTGLKAALPVGAAIAGIAALNKSNVKPLSSRGEGRAADSPAAPKGKPKVSNIPPTDGLINNPNYGRPADKSTWKNPPGSPSGKPDTPKTPSGKPDTPKTPETKAPEKPKTPSGKPDTPKTPETKAPEKPKAPETKAPETPKTPPASKKKESWRTPKAELEQIRGNAALKSISQSPNAERILKGKKGKEALERSSAMLRKESTSKTVMGIAEAYASIYEKKCVDKKDKGMHNCAKKVCHEEYGEGETIFGQHAVPDENGFVSHYDVQFEHGIVENVSVEELEIITEGSHNEENHHYEGEMVDEGALETAVNAGKNIGKKVLKAVGKVIEPADNSPEAQAARMGKRRPQTSQEKSVAAGTVNKESVDVFDVVKGHLIDEGYADSEESALAIMANMTEGQRTEIIKSFLGRVDNVPRNLGTAVGTAERVGREVSGYLKQKAQNVKNTFDSARARASSDNELTRSGRMPLKQPEGIKKPAGVNYGSR
jgi:ElaB/YqjD/DUF883 family membrane-anchored ribosome-binding protein